MTQSTAAVDTCWGWRVEVVTTGNKGEFSLIYPIPIRNLHSFLSEYIQPHSSAERPGINSRDSVYQVGCIYL